jgi:rhamnose utilization protein RhaD (predicted bifunctional aldolase and dehydrogenase)/NAD(P)-dependent dehydrogenase (short-subunit alcohol dehydrogenase family)
VKSLWSEADAEAIVARFAERGVGREVALCVHGSRLLGGDKRLVLHGGGNTSVKTVLPDLSGEPAEVLCIKGSGWDLAALEPEGLPAVRLAPLKALRRREALDDVEMVRLSRAALLDPAAPNISVEALLHAFLPHRYVDHTHSVAVLSLADQPDGAAICAEVFGGRLGIVPYVRPGLPLAQAAADAFEADPDVIGLVLVKHGIVTFADSAAEAYRHMIDMVSLAEMRIARGRHPVFVARALPADIAAVAEVAPILRGVCAIPDPATPALYRRFVLDFRGGEAVRPFVDGAELSRYGMAGVATPDHVIRTKNHPLIVPPPVRGHLDAFAAEACQAVERFAADYRVYFACHNAASAAPTLPSPASGGGLGRGKRELDPMPRVILVPGLGLFGLGHNAKDAAIAADIAESWVETVTGAEAIGSFESLSEAELFEMEYWSLEQAKLGQATEEPLAGQVALVTGGAGTIGFATAAAMREAGAEIVLLDLDARSAAEAAARLGEAALGLACDVADPASVRAAFDRAAEHFGGVDIVVSNAGAALQGRIGEIEDAVLRRSFELNFFAHQSVAQTALRLMLAQKTGGCLLFNVSKQAVSPGPNFGPYGLPKAATLALMRQYALEYGGDGIRANAVNADGIRGGLLTPEMIAARAAAYGMTEAQYMGRNLLGHEVTAGDVAQAFLSLALARSTTGAFVTVDGGNIAAAPR